MKDWADWVVVAIVTVCLFGLFSLGGCASGPCWKVSDGVIACRS